MNLGHLDFDIVSDFNIRISDFASLGPLHLSRTLYKSHLLCKTNPILIRAKINLTLYIKKVYGNFTYLRTMKNEPKTNPIKANTNPIKANIMPKQTQYEPNQTQTKPISDYPCVFELAVYNLVLRDGNVMHSMPNGRNFDGEFTK